MNEDAAPAAAFAGALLFGIAFWCCVYLAWKALSA